MTDTRYNLFLTGANGFLGKRLYKKLANSNYNVFAPTHAECDVEDAASLKQYFEHIPLHAVIHAAGFLGGINFSREFPAKVFVSNLKMAANILELVEQKKVRELITVGSACVYSDQIGRPFKETDVFSLPMHDSVKYYGFSKLALLLGGQSLASQHPINSKHVMPANLYGPGDKFDPEFSHVISSLIPKFYHAMKTNQPTVVCWGSGNTIRDFIYVEDCAEGIVRLLRSKKKNVTINLGTGVGIKIKELAEIIKAKTGFMGEIHWDTSIEDGAMYKVLDTTEMEKTLNWRPKTDFIFGIEQTIDAFSYEYENWLQKQKKDEINQYE